MASNVKLGSAGVTAREVDQTNSTSVEPLGIPAGVIGTSVKGPAFVPVTVGIKSDYDKRFGQSDGTKFGPLAVYEWLRNARSITYLRVLGIGDGNRRDTSTKPGRVVNAGFVVGEQQPHESSGILSQNTYANAGGPLGRLYVLGCFMSESNGSSVFSSASLQGANSVTPGAATAVPILRGVLMAPSGVLVRLSSSFSIGSSSAAPSSGYVAVDATASGSLLGSVNLSAGKQEFVVLLNGHKGTDSAYPNAITASFDPTSPNYFANVMNRDPYSIQKAGHYLYASWDVHPSLAVVTGTNLISSSFSAGPSGGMESAAFVLTGSVARDSGTSTVPNYENWEDRFTHAKSPWIVSQRLGGTPRNLFRFVSLDAGADVASRVKVSVENIAPSTDSRDPYGTFDVIVREWDDTDSDVRALEQFRGLSLNPSSDRYVAKAIGDLNVYYDFDRATASQKLVVDGSYPNASNHVRVELDESVVNGEVDSTALPVGFRGPAHLVTSGSAPMATSTASTTNGGLPQGLVVPTALKRVVQPPVPYRLQLTEGTGNKALVNPSLYWGLQTEQVVSTTDPNSSKVKDASIKSFTYHFPLHMTTVQNVLEDDAVGESDTAATAILDVDRFNRNLFTLENVRVVTGSDGLADPRKWTNAVYVRHGSVGTNATDKTRAVSVSDFTQTNRRFLKFTTLLQGGSDGVNPFDRNEAQLTNVAVTHDMADSNRGLQNGPTAGAYRKALDVMKEKSDVDVQILAVPGIRHPIVTDKAIDTVGQRFDAMYVMDVEEYDSDNLLITGSAQVPSVANTVTALKDRALNSSFAASYYPDVVVTDPSTRTNLQVPPSVAVLGAIAKNDAVAHPWFAPAGFARGALETTLEAAVKLSKGDMDSLYDANCNPLVAFANSTPAGSQAQGGCVIFGQRTMQSFASSLDRVNVRRLLIDIRRQVREISQTFIFEPNRASTLSRFSASVEPRLAKIKRNFGIEKYKIQIDLTTTTQADIENNTVRGVIIIKPTRSIEFVSLDFVLSNTGQG